MALPPIISNSPIFKLFQSDSVRSKQGAAKSDTAQTPADIVDISQAAQERLNGVKQFSMADRGAIKQAASEAGAILQHDDNLSLGLDPAFDS